MNVIEWALEDIDMEAMAGRTSGWNTGASAGQDGNFVRGGWFNNSSTLGQRKEWPALPQGGIRYDYFSNGLSWSGNATAIANARPEMVLYDADGTGRFRLFPIQSPTDGAYRAHQLERWDGGAWQVVGVYDPTAADSGVRRTFTFLWSIDASAGFLRFYVDGALQLEYAGDTTVGGSSGLAAIETQGYTAAGYTTGMAHGISQLVIGDGDVRYVHGVARAPTTAGTHTAWTGDRTAIDESTESTADIISGAAVGDRESWNCSPLGVTFAGMSVIAVGQVAMAKKGATGPATLEQSKRVGGVDYDAGGHALTDTYARYTDLWTTNPATSAAWTQAAIDAIEDGVEANT